MFIAENVYKYVIFIFVGWDKLSPELRSIVLVTSLPSVSSELHDYFKECSGHTPV